MGQRLVYIDVLRGICIFIVLYTHVVQFSLPYSDYSTVHRFLTLWFLHMFFFISGYVGYRERNDWNLVFVSSFLKKKIKTILIPTISAISLYILCVNTNVDDMLCSSSKGGYWFTFVLFEMQVIYTFVMYVISRIHNTRHKSIAVLSIALLSYMITKTVNMNSIVMDIFCLKGLFTYFPFFLLGVLCKMNNNMYVMCLSNKRVQFALLAILVIGFKTNYIPSVVLSSVSCFVVIFSIRKMEENMTYETCLPIVKKMTKSFFSLFSCIGQYSIEIYFLHFLLLFKLPQSVSDYLYSGYIENSYGHTYSSIIELIVVGSVSLLLALLCIMISQFLKQLPFMDRLLFGKIKTNK